MCVCIYISRFCVAFLTPKKKKADPKKIDVTISHTPLKTNMSPENQWLEHVYHIERLSLFQERCQFWGGLG